FFGVADIDAAVMTVRELGGEAEDPGPEEPGFGRFTFCRDDQGVRFGLHQPAHDTA
ncbi:VOC family protein, partial [Mycobacteroides abscessus subsp. massiliense]